METSTVNPVARALASPSAYRPFRTAAVLGAGTMGAQIAAHLANAGLQVHLLDMAAPEGDKNAIVQRQFKKALKTRPDPFFTEATARRIQLGNFDEHFDRIGEVDWVIEAVVERLDVKRSVMERLEATVREDAVVSTNTSGIPIREIAEGRSEAFQRRFLGTHFFNPPRYLKLLELIPTAATDPEITARVAAFGRLHLGKGIVVANDVPYFIGNRIGIYGMMVAMRHFLEGDYTIEEIDLLTGTLIGRPKSATFRTADVVGLDVMLDVSRNLYEKAVDDESRDVFKAPPLLEQLVERGALGAKAGAGFYKKEGKVILSINPETGTYEPPREPNLGDLDAIKAAGSLPDRLRALYADEGRAGAFFRDTTLQMLGYSARRIPEVTDNPADVDRAICWGFGWEMGPFQIWDALGFDRVLEDMAAAGVEVPAWVHTMKQSGSTAFYRESGGVRHVYHPGDGGYVPDPRPADEISLAVLKRDERKTLWKNADAALLDLGDGVALYEFRSKANTLGQFVMEGLNEVIERVEADPDLRGLVIGNEGANFSVGANLGEVAMAAMQGEFEQIAAMVKGFQDTVQRIRYATKPVVVATHQRVLGGGCELVMACPNPVAAAESYIGLVELGVGLIPAGTGTMRLAAEAAARAPHGHPSEVQAWIQVFFENVAMARVATSARQAQEMAYLAPHARIVMNADRRLYVAKEEVIRLSNEGYLPPPVMTHIQVLGRPAAAALAVAVQQYLEGGFISEYDAFLARRLAHVLTGGDLTMPQEVHEDYLLELEREVFLKLLGEQKTQERITHLLMHNKPLRN
ncbi:MAG: 3-hydroxyacyl-CoA dehydrogenase/enoyl-CoA hydratase family protein [Bacteroidetes bacterium]|nr:MAG: 3-hydroxyacyl-CoA dehydrogenase/enoyl-CoA hydratase family protein [Bacteroidota bacterium]